MPGRAEYGLLAGLGQGIAQAGQMAFADHLQQMREARLAKIASDAADGKFSRDKELLGMEAANRREELGIKNQQERDMIGLKVDEEVRGKKEIVDHYLINGLSANGKEPKTQEWDVVSGADEFGNKIPTGISNGQNFVDFGTPLGKVVKSFLDKGAPASVAVMRGQEALMQAGNMPAATDQPQNQSDEPGFWGGLMGSFFKDDQPANSLPVSSQAQLPPRVPQPAQEQQPATPNSGLLSRGLKSLGGRASDALYSIAPDGIRAAREGRM